MSDNPKISVLVAAYNIEKYISKCIESILAQTYENLEIIIIDDGSSDDTLKICEDFAKTAANIKVIHQQNQGLSAVRNNGLKAATGEMVTFIDGDDYIEKDYVEKLFKAMNDSDISVCGHKKVPGVEFEIPKNEMISGKAATVKLLTEQENYQIVSWGKLYRRELFDDILFPVGKKNEDSLTTYKVLAAAKKVSFIDKPLYYYVQRKDSIMGSGKLKEQLDNKMLAAKEAGEYFKKDKELSEAAKIAELLAVYSYLDNIIAGRLKGNQKQYFDWLKENSSVLKKNKYVTKRLKKYLTMSTFCGGILYKMFRKIKN